MNVAVLGCGLIGGSVALAWRRAFPDAAVVGYDRDSVALERAFAEGALTRRADSPVDAVDGADLVIIAAPVGSIVDLVREVAPALAPGTLVTDTGSVKAPIVSEIRKALPGVAFIGGHPMAGTEQQGFAAASADLFAGAWWFVTPDGPGDADAAAKLGPPLRSLGAKVVEVDPVCHDRIVAAISHVPMLLAASLVHLAGTPIDGEDARIFAGGGFRDMTRIADSNPQLWLEICLENRTAIIEALSALSAETSRLERSLFEGDREGLSGFLAGARASRRMLPEKAERPSLTVLAVEVPDRPGTLAAVSRILGEADVNIEDIRVAHTPAGDRGWFFLTVAASEVQRSMAALTAEGFVVEHLSR
jgi:prephenate dehydrogenase